MARPAPEVGRAASGRRGGRAGDGRAERTALSHVGPDGRAHMVDTAAKPVTEREAVAEARVRLAPATMRLVRAGGGPKGDVLAVARLAGIQGAKETSRLIPLCHPLALTSVHVETKTERAGVRIRTRVRAVDRTGVEMEALTAAAVAALTVIDMVKAVDRSAEIVALRLLEKSGGRSGHWRRSSASRS